MEVQVLPGAPFFLAIAILVSAPSPAAEFRPFFDAENGGAGDPSPPPPRLSAFDWAVLEVCGAWGSHPGEGAFRRMLDRPELAEDLAFLHRALDGSVDGPPRSMASFKDQLAGRWFRSGGFVHVFCGEPGAERLGGLHFQGRYLEMQEKGWGGLAPASVCARNEIVPPVYTVGVAYRAPQGGTAVDCVKGYALGQDARSLLVAASRAYKAAGRDGMCLAPAEGGFQAVLVRREGGIRTYYPDATPRCDGGRPSCACGG